MNAEEGRLIRTLLSRRPGQASVWPALAGALMLVAVSLVSWTDFGGLASLLPATHEAVLGRGEYWRLFTTLGVHGDFKHLLSNAAYFFGLAFMLHAYFGALAFPLGALVLGALQAFLTMLTHEPGITSIGASGVVYLMMGFWLTSYFCIERRLSVGRRLLVATGFALSLLVPSEFEPRVDHLAHAIGFALGIAGGVVHFEFRRTKIRAAEEWVFPKPDVEVEVDLPTGQMSALSSSPDPGNPAES